MYQGTCFYGGYFGSAASCRLRTVYQTGRPHPLLLLTTLFLLRCAAEKKRCTLVVGNMEKARNIGVKLQFFLWPSLHRRLTDIIWWHLLFWMLKSRYQCCFPSTFFAAESR